MMLKGRTSTIYSENALMQLALAKTLGADGADIKTLTLDGLKAFALMPTMKVAILSARCWLTGRI